MYPKLVLFVGLLCSGSGWLNAQVNGGRTTYNFLRLPTNARIAALGGNLITVVDDDINLAAINPGALNPAMDQQLSFNHGFIGNVVNYGYLGFGKQWRESPLCWQLGLQYARYGEVLQTNEFFQIEGTFRASELALGLGASYPLDERVSVGTNLKLISSQLGAYQSYGLATDWSAVYQDTAKQITLALVVRNLGAQLSTYGLGGEREPLPFDVQIGISKRLRYLPFRFSLIYDNLHRWNVRYDDPNQEDGVIFLGEEQAEESDLNIFVDNLFRHFVFNGELLIGARDNFRLRFGYQHRLRQELLVQGFGGLAGFSFGVGLKVNRFRIDIGRSTYHLAGGQTLFSLSTNFKDFK